MLLSAAMTTRQLRRLRENKSVQRFLKTHLVPLLPGIISAGLINGIINVIDFSTGKAYANECGSQLSGPWLGTSLTAKVLLVRTLPRSLAVLVLVL